MKKTAVMLLFLASLNGMAQTLTYRDANKVLFKENGLTISEFHVHQADEAYMQAVQEKLLPYEKEIRFDYRSMKSENSFDARIAFIPEIDLTYLVKILTFLEINEVTLKDEVISIEDLLKGENR